MLATLRGEAVDRPAFNFCEITGCEDIHSDDPFCIYTHPSWHPLIALARERTDRLPLRGIPFHLEHNDVKTNISFTETGSRVTEMTRRLGSQTFRQVMQQDRDVLTVWTTEHWLKSADDLRVWLDAPFLPPVPPHHWAQGSTFLDLEREIGDSGLAMLDTADPLCLVAPLFDMATFTEVAFTEPELFRSALDCAAELLFPFVEAAAAEWPGRFWRIYGPEYASPPYLPPHLFREYVVPYVRTMVEMIHRHGGWVRVHSHGRLRDILDDICATGCDAIDPIEPPHQGDVELAYVREKYGAQLVLFGNIEACDIENLPTPQFRDKIRRALDEGTRGAGRGFVLHPSSAPYGRILSPLSLRNYEAMVEICG